MNETIKTQLNHRTIRAFEDQTVNKRGSGFTCRSGAKNIIKHNIHKPIRLLV